MINLIKNIVSRFKCEHYWEYLFNDGIRKHYECNKCGKRDCT